MQNTDKFDELRSEHEAMKQQIQQLDEFRQWFILCLAANGGSLKFATIEKMKNSDILLDGKKVVIVVGGGKCVLFDKQANELPATIIQKLLNGEIDNFDLG